MEDMNMGSTANKATKTEDQKQSGCCCGSTSDAPQSTATEIRKTVAAVESGSAVKEIPSDQSGGCCGGR